MAEAQPDWHQRASEVLATSGPVASPCRSVCIMNPDSGWCEGCGRSIGEIAAWGSLPDAAKRDIWRLIPQRLQAY